MSEITWTHKGWFGFCPIYLAEVESDGPIVDHRHWSLLPLMWLSELAVFPFVSVSGMFPFFITGEVKK